MKNMCKTAPLRQLLLLAIAMLASVCVHANSDLPVSPLQLTEEAKDDSGFTWKQLISGQAIIAVWNSSQADMEGAVRFTDFSSPDGRVLTNISAVPFGVTSKGSTKLPKLEITRLVLAVKVVNGAKPQPGSYTGFVIIEDGTKQFAPFSKQMTIKVAGPSPALPKLTATAWRLIPFSPFWWSKASLPLKDADVYPDPTNKHQFIGFVDADTGGYAPVWWLRNRRKSDGYMVADVHVDRLPHAGKYDGSVSFHKDNVSSTDDLELTLIAKDIVVWPIISIIGGIYVAFIAKRYLGVLRITWTLLKQEAAIGDAYKHAQEQFTNATRGTSYGRYSIAQDVNKQREFILGLIDKVDEQRWLTDLTSNQNYKDATEALGVLEAQIGDWAALGRDLSSLATTLSTVTTGIDWSVKLPPKDEENWPVLCEKARNLLIGRPKKMAELGDLHKKAVDTTDLLKSWDSVNKRIKPAAKELAQWRQRNDLTPAQNDALNTAHDQLVIVWKRLWQAETSADLASICSAGSELDSVEIALAKIDSAPSTRTKVGYVATPLDLIRRLGPTPRVAPFLLKPDYLSIDHLPANDTRRFALLTKAITFGDFASALLAFTVALLTGLNENYLGKPFGTIQDYIVLFLWAVGTKATLDIVTSVLDRYLPAQSK